MTDDQCNACRYADYVRYDDGDMFTCEKLAEPEMPFDMDNDTLCPFFENVDEAEKDEVDEDEVLS